MELLCPLYPTMPHPLHLNLMLPTIIFARYTQNSPLQDPGQWESLAQGLEGLGREDTQGEHLKKGHLCWGPIPDCWEHDPKNREPQKGKCHKGPAVQPGILSCTSPYTPHITNLSPTCPFTHPTSPISSLPMAWFTVTSLLPHPI